MLSVTLGEKNYTVPYVRAQALREIARPMEIVRRTEQEENPAAFGRDLDVLVSWFCVMFGNQFTPEEVYAQYPADRLVHDIALAVFAVAGRVSQALSAFPTPAAGRTETAASE